MTERLLHCPDCGQDQLFSTVECVEGHGRSCPELACTRCAIAVVHILELRWPRPARPALRDAA